MSQNSLVLPNTGTLTGLALVNGVNSALDSLNTLNSGAGAPSVTEADMVWMDTTNGLRKQRDPTNAIWLAQAVRGIAHGGGMRHSGQSSIITANTTLTAASIGQLVILQATSPITLTLPNASTVPAGCGFILDNYGSKVTLALQGGNTSDTGLYLATGDQLLVVSDGTSVWRFLFRSNALLASIGQSGYLQQPGGLIEQWGSTVVTTNSAGGFAITYPESFPNNVFTCLVTIGDNNLTPLIVQTINSQLSLSAAGGVAMNSTTGTGLNTQSVRLNYIVKGN